ncbi:hypothetical protein D918_06077 [Trichuris suis]|nr:hypothetical protein D918_06077 [Trichuris suis]
MVKLAYIFFSALWLLQHRSFGAIKRETERAGTVQPKLMQSIVYPGFDELGLRLHRTIRRLSKFTFENFGTEEMLWSWVILSDNLNLSLSRKDKSYKMLRNRRIFAES